MAVQSPPIMQGLKKLHTQSQGIMSLCTWAHKIKIRLLVRGHEPFPYPNYHYCRWNPERTAGVAVYAFRGDTGMMKWGREQAKTRAGIQLLSKELGASCTHIPEESKGGGGAASEQSPLFQKADVLVWLSACWPFIMGWRRAVRVRSYHFIRAESGLGSPYIATLSLNLYRQ